MSTVSIAQGELWLHAPGRAPQQIQSAFAKEWIERAIQSRRTTGWKHAPRDEQKGVIPSASLWGQAAQNDESLVARFLHVCRGADEDTIFYVLAVGQTRGLFRRHLAEDREVRLFHRSGWECEGLAYNAADQRLIVSSRNPDGTCHLEVYDEDGNRRGAITDGDCIDTSPALVPGHSKTVVYQSMGLARNVESGHVVAYAHACVHRVDYGSGELEVLVDDSKYDFVAPHMDGLGRLYAIRRPVERPVQQRAGSALTDTLLMPFRLLKAVFGYLNFFSMVYGKEPLRSAGGPRTPALDQDLGRLWLHGRMIELSKVRNDPHYAGQLVPKDWELIRMDSPGRAPEVLAQHVASFDVHADNSVVYTNGFDITELRGDQRQVLGRQQQVSALGSL
jgi:hypothetical protein